MTLTHSLSKRQRAIVLPMVLIVGFLLTTAILTFVRRSLVDGMLIQNRDRARAAEALARGGIQIGKAVLFQYRLDAQLDAQDSESGSTALDQTWHQLGDARHITDWGGSLVVKIEDSGSRLNLNSLVPIGTSEEESQASDEAEEFLKDFIDKILEELESARPEQGDDSREMARNLIDYIDGDDVAISGKREDDYYESQDPPYRAPNGPLLSVEELAMVEGFDAQIAQAMAPYVTVYPLLGGPGINVNTAPPHVLALIYQGSSGDMRLASEDIVRDIMKERSEGRIICSATETDPDRCVGLSEVGLNEGSIFPDVNWPLLSAVFRIEAEARVGRVVRRIEAVIDFSNGTDPQLLSWKSL